jgi:inosose dehydratase
LIRVANAPCSWGVLEFELNGARLGYAQVLDEMRDSGYAGTELGDWGFMPNDPSFLRSELAARDLEMVAAFVPVDFSNPSHHTAGTEAALRTAELLAAVQGSAPVLVLADANAKRPTRTQNAGRIQPEHGLSAEQWDAFAAGVEQVAAAVRERTGLRSAFHHHCAGFVETPQEIDHLLQRTDPDLVGLCFDTGHSRFGGGDPLQLLTDYGTRVRHVHLKDHDPSVAARARQEQWDYFASLSQGVFCELGHGDVDFASIRRVLEELDYRGWVVAEQDRLPGMSSPLESARANREYLRSIGF